MTRRVLDMYMLSLVFILMSSSTLLAGTTLQGSTAPVGMILQTEGEVFVEGEAGRNVARLGNLLQAGDQLIVSSGGATFLFCPSKEKVTLSGGTSIELGSDSIEIVAGETPHRESVGGCALPRVSLGQASLERVGGLRARGHPPIVLYVGGPISQTYPLFQWEPIEGSESYKLSLRSELGVIVWEQSTTSPRVVYPESMAALEEGKDFQWEVQALRGGEILAEQRANFVVKTDPELSERPGSDPGDQLLRATTLENAGYFAESADYFRQLREAHPDDIRFTRHLAWLYWNAGLISAANQERERLDSQE